jgi:hypothetical protein
VRTTAGLVASFPAAWVTKHKGRKVSMVLSGAMYMIGACVWTVVDQRFGLLRLVRSGWLRGGAARRACHFPGLC